MAIFRGTGGSGNSTDDSIVDAVTEQAGIATTKASEAATSATNAASSASAASSSATTAATKATEATTAKTDAETAETNAQTAQSAAETARDQAQTSATSAATSANTANSAAVQTVAGSNTQVVGVYNNIGSVNTVAGDITNVNTVAGISSDVTTVAADASDIGTVSSNIGNVNNVGNNISNVNSVAGNASNINTVASDGTDIGTVAGNISNVNTVAGISSNVTTVAGLETKMDTVIADASDIGTVAGNINDVSAVAGISSDVTSVADNSSNINSVASNMTAVQGASTNATNAATSASNASDSASAASTSASTASTKAIEAASSATSASNSATTATTKASQASTSASTATTKASEAAASATSASSSATTATTKATEAAASATAASGSATTASTKATEAAASAALFTNLTAATGAAGSDANYNNATGVLTVPRGDTGAQGPQGNNGSLTVDTVSGDLSFADNGKAKFGAGDDLQIYHDGTRSIIRDAGTGDLLIRATNLRLQNADGTNYLNGISGGAVNLFHNNSAKLATTSTGVDVTGTVTADGVSTDSLTNASGNLNIASTGSILLKFDSDNNQTNREFNLQHDSGASLIKVTEGGDISFYEDTGTTPKLFWDSSAERLGLGTTSPSANVEISGIGEPSLKITDTGDNKAFSMMVSPAWATDSLVFLDASAGTARMVINDTGNVGIGTTSPTRPLDVTKSVGSIIANFKNSGGTSAFITLGNTTSTADQIRVGSNGSALTLSTNYAERMRIDSSGNVGIGTSSAGTKLDISTEANKAGLRVTAPNTTNQSFGATFTAGTSSSDYALNVDNAAGSPLFRIRGDGTTGIGTSAPAAKLDVSGGTTYPAFKTSRDGGSAASQGYTTFGHSAIGYSGGTGADTYIVSEHGYGFAVNGGTTALAITDTGLCGIGTTAPSSALDVTGTVTSDGLIIGGGGVVKGERGTASAPAYSFSDDADTGMFNISNADLGFSVGGTERMRIDSSGNLLVGNTTATPASGFNNQKGFGYAASSGKVEIATTADSAVLELGKNHANDGDLLVLRKQSNIIGAIGTSSGEVFIGSGDTTLRFFAAGDAVLPRGTGGGQRDGLISLGSGSNRFKDLHLSGDIQQGNGDYIYNGGGNFDIKHVSASQNITFHTTPSGGSATERMRLDSSGNLLVGKTSTSGSTAGISLKPNGQIEPTADGTYVSYFNRKSSDGVISYYAKDGSVVGSISVTSSATTYNTTSDERLKENIQDAEDAGSKIDAIKVRQFDWKADGSHQDYGVIAQELAEVAPEAVTEGETEDDMMAVDYSKLVPTLIKEIQTLRNRVAQLEE